MHFTRFVGVSAIALAAGFSNPAFAQATVSPTTASPPADSHSPASVTPASQTATSSANDDQIGDIIVTATKHAENLRDVPASISAISSSALQQKAVVNLIDLNATVPGLQISPNNTDVSVTLRGVGHALFSPSAENAVALHLDGTYLSRPASALAAFFDVDRVEVLRGPQGSLYGRNATGGAINIISVAPSSTPSGFMSVTAANYQRIDVEGAVGGPIAGDLLTGRIGGFYHRRNQGFGTNLADGADVDDLNEYGGKVSLKAQLSDAFSFTVRGDYYHADDSYGEYHAFGPVRAPFPGALPLAELLGGQNAADVRDTNFDTPNHRHMNLWGVSGEANWKLSDTLSLKSLTSYRDTKSTYQTDPDGTQLPIFDPFILDAKARQVSEELQLSWKTDNLFAIVGAYYFHEKVDSTILINSYLATGIPSFGIPRILPAPFGVFDQHGHLTTEAKALFGNLDWKVTDRLTFGFGMRYSTESKANSGYEIAFFPDFADYPTTGYDVVNASRTSSGATPSFNVKYAVSDTVNVYASVSRGFKSGEWISGTSQYAKPERVWAYEAGIKGALFDHHLSFSFAGFYYDYTDLQVQRVQTPITVLENAPGGKLKGVEGEASVRLPAGFSVDGNFTYLDTKIEGFVTQNPNISGSPAQDLTGNRFAFAPKFTFNLGAQKQFKLWAAGKGVLRVDYQHTSPTFLDVFNSTTAAYRPAYSIVNASFKQSFGNGLSILFWGKNLTDKTVKLYEIENSIPNLILTHAGVPVPVASTAVGNLNDPRTYGATLRFDW